MNDWFDEWLNSPPHRPDDDDRDGYYQDTYRRDIYFESYFNESDPEELTFFETVFYGAFGALVYALVGISLLLIALVGILLLITTILHLKVALWATLIALTGAALWWTKREDQQ